MVKADDAWRHEHDADLTGDPRFPQKGAPWPQVVAETGVGGEVRRRPYGATWRDQWGNVTELRPVEVADQLAAEIDVRLTHLGRLADHEAQAEVIMRLRRLDEKAARSVVAALYPWGWPDGCGAAQWWLTPLGMACGRALMLDDTSDGMLTEPAMAEATTAYRGQKGRWFIRSTFGGGRRWHWRLKDTPYPYTRRAVWTHNCGPARNARPAREAIRVRATIEWLNRLGIRVVD